MGKTGHRVVEQIAHNHLTKKARKNVQKILGNESLAHSGNWMDFIRSDKSYDHQQLSFTEYSMSIDFASETQEAQWQNSTVLDWANESKSLREQVYTLPEDKFIAYRYTFDNINTLNQRLLQAGIRLAGILNQIYG